MVSLEVRTAQMERVTSPALITLWGVRAEMRGHAIAARAAADGALGAAAALATYVREGLGGVAGQRRGTAPASAVHHRDWLTAVALRRELAVTRLQREDRTRRSAFVTEIIK